MSDSTSATAAYQPPRERFHCDECWEAAKACKHDNHAVSGDGGQTWECQGCAMPLTVNAEGTS